jgi:hypothetical protein
MQLTDFCESSKTYPRCNNNIKLFYLNLGGFENLQGLLDLKSCY